MSQLFVHFDYYLRGFSFYFLAKVKILTAIGIWRSGFWKLNALLKPLVWSHCDCCLLHLLGKWITFLFTLTAIYEVSHFIFLAKVKILTAIGIWRSGFWKLNALLKPLVWSHFDCYLLRLLSKWITFLFTLTTICEVSHFFLGPKSRFSPR